MPLSDQQPASSIQDQPALRDSLTNAFSEVEGAQHGRYQVVYRWVQKLVERIGHAKPQCLTLTVVESTLQVQFRSVHFTVFGPTAQDLGNQDLRVLDPLLESCFRMGYALGSINYFSVTLVNFAL